MSVKHSTHLLTNIINKLERVSGPDKDGWHTALCPFHDDQHRPNLRFNTNGFRCMSCGERGGLKKLATKLGVESNSEHFVHRIIDIYDYKDEKGELIFQVVRYEPKSFAQRRPDGNGSWIWKLDGVRRVLYMLPDLLAAPMQSIVFLPEGEKDVKALQSIDLIATCNPGGAGKFTSEMRWPLKDRHVVIIADKDEVGRRHAWQVAALLYGFTASVKIIELPGETIKDAADWVAAGDNRESLEKLVAATHPWKPESGCKILDDVASFIRRFVVLTSSQIEAITLWIIHTHNFESADATPYLNIHSAEKRSGKTRLLEVLEQLVNKPWFTGRATPAVLARKIDKEKPTLLLDESDAAFKGDKEYSQTLRGILNSGYRRGGKSSICIGQGANIDYKDLSTFCPKAIAGIGSLPDTIADRSIPIKLRRRTRNETVARFRQKEIEPEALPIRASILRWISEINPADQNPAIPEDLNDRAADCWEPLLTIADIAGGDWPERGRKAALELMTGSPGEDESIGVRLLRDIQSVFKNYQHIASVNLVSALKTLEESPWGDIDGRLLDPRRLAALLKPYEIRPRTIRDAESTFKGYHRTDFIDAWERYLHVNDTSSVTSVTSVTPASNQLQSEATFYASQTTPKDPDVTDDFQSYVEGNVTPVTDRTRETEKMIEKSTGWNIEI